MKGIVTYSECKLRVIKKSELSGMDEKDINPSVEDSLLTISGEKKAEKCV